jgi:hypothetical protein
MWWQARPDHAASTNFAYYKEQTNFSESDESICRKKRDADCDDSHSFSSVNEL